MHLDEAQREINVTRDLRRHSVFQHSSATKIPTMLTKLLQGLGYAALTIVSGEGAIPAVERERAALCTLAFLAGVPAVFAEVIGGSVTRQGPANVEGRSLARR